MTLFIFLVLFFVCLNVFSGDAESLLPRNESALPSCWKELDYRTCHLGLDKVIFAYSCSGVYAGGSVWVRNRSVFYKPIECGKAMKVTYACCPSYRLNFENEGVAWPETLKGLQGELRDFARSSDEFLEFMSSRYPFFPRRDVQCALVGAIRESVCSFLARADGLCDLEFSSWARFVTSHARREGDRVVVAYGQGDEYERGSIWIRSQESATMLCYRPYTGPDWLCYHYDLNATNLTANVWPSNWREVHCAFKYFAECEFTSEEGSNFFSMIPEGQRYVDVVRVVLGGRAADFDEKVGYAWHPESFADIKGKEDDVLLSGRLCLFYWPESAWVVNSSRKDAALRYCSRDRIVFQFRPEYVPNVGIFSRLHSHLLHGHLSFERWVGFVEELIESEQNMFGFLAPTQEHCTFKQGDAIICIADGHTRLQPGDIYAPGAMWVRCEANGMKSLCYRARPEEGVSFSFFGCNYLYSFSFNKKGTKWPKQVNKVFHSFLQGMFDADLKTLRSFLSQPRQTSLPVDDMMCAIVLGLKASLLGKPDLCLGHGMPDKMFNSHACFVPGFSHKALGLQPSPQGFVWASCEEEKWIVWHKPHEAPDWFVYRYAADSHLPSDVCVDGLPFAPKKPKHLA